MKSYEHLTGNKQNENWKETSFYFQRIPQKAFF